MWAIKVEFISMLHHSSGFSGDVAPLAADMGGMDY
jgi:hypothetical protein